MSAPASSSPSNGQMTIDMLRKVCVAVAMFYLALIFFFLSNGQNWDFALKLPIDTPKEIHGRVVGLLGTPACAVVFLFLAALMRIWNERVQPASAWNKFPVPYGEEIPETDPFGRGYRIVLFVLIFGFGLYIQGYLFNAFLEGRVFLDGTDLTGANADPSKCDRCVIAGGLDHFTHGFGSLLGTTYRFESKEGHTYFLGWSPWSYLALTLAMVWFWWRSTRRWLGEIVLACARLLGRTAAHFHNGFRRSAPKQPRAKEGGGGRAWAAVKSGRRRLREAVKEGYASRVKSAPPKPTKQKGKPR